MSTISGRRWACSIDQVPTSISRNGKRIYVLCWLVRLFACRFRLETAERQRESEKGHKSRRVRVGRKQRLWPKRRRGKKEKGRTVDVQEMNELMGV